MIFELIVVDTRTQSEEINDTAPKDIPNYHAYAVSVSQGLCGLHYRGHRPNVLTRKHRELTTELELAWERECLIPAMKRGYTESLN